MCSYSIYSKKNSFINEGISSGWRLWKIYQACVGIGSVSDDSIYIGVCFASTRAKTPAGIIK